MALKTVALTAMVLLSSATVAQVPPLQMPDVKDRSGQRVNATGVVCINQDGTPCSFGGSGSGNADTTAAPGSNSAKGTGVQGIDGGKPIAATDASNLSYVFAPSGGSADNSTAASYTFSSASQAAARGWYANCPTGTTVTITLLGVYGGSAPRTVYDGWQDGADRISGFSGNTAGCTIGERF